MTSAGEGAVHVLAWTHAVQLQKIRIMSGIGLPTAGPVTKQADAYLFVLALRNVRRAAALTGRLAGGQPQVAIRRALVEFDHALPTAKDLRDVLDHFDDYALGRGKLQDRKRPWPVIEWYEESPDTYRLNIGVGGKLLAVEVAAASHASQELLDSIAQALTWPAAQGGSRRVGDRPLPVLTASNGPHRSPKRGGVNREWLGPRVSLLREPRTSARLATRRRDQPGRFRRASSASKLIRRRIARTRPWPLGVSCGEDVVRSDTGRSH
jgi:hypothetical protein